MLERIFPLQNIKSSNFSLLVFRSLNFFVFFSTKMPQCRIQMSGNYKRLKIANR